MSAETGHGGGFTDPALTISIALAAGLFCQALAHHLRLPGIVLLLAAGAILGPDGFNIVRPELLDGTLQSLVGFAVAVILFEGGMNLNIRRLKRESNSIRQLITTGAIVTAIGGTLAAKWIMGWDWRLSILFGTLVIVTGPTVITPLLRRIKLNPKLSTVLEAEGVLIDPIGAIIAVVALEVAIQPSGSEVASGFLAVAGRLGLGAGLGLAGGFFLAYLLRPKWLIPEGMHNTFTLAWVLALFHVSNALLPESGIATVTVAGLVVGNVRSDSLHELMEFKEQLTMMLIALLFVLLSANVRLDDIKELGMPGLMTVLALMLIVRPINILVGTIRSDLTFREKSFMAWMAPRGIVAAAVASFFEVTLTAAGIEGGRALTAMVFLVIAVTVLVQGLTGGVVAQVLGVRRPPRNGYAILGTLDLGLVIGKILRDAGQSVLFLDSNADGIKSAQDQGFKVVFGNALEERILQRAQLDSFDASVSVTPNESVNLLFSTKASEEFKIPKNYVGLHFHKGHITNEMVEKAHGTVLFGQERDIDLWSLRVNRGSATPEKWLLTTMGEVVLYDNSTKLTGSENDMLPLVRHRKSEVVPVNNKMNFQEGDEVTFLIFEDNRKSAEEWLRAHGWTRPSSVTEAKGQPTP